MNDNINNYHKQATSFLRIVEEKISENRDDFSSIIKHNLALNNKLYCKNSTLFLGCFNPCPIEDLIVKDSKRGKIVSKGSLSKNIIIYYFENNLIKMAEDAYAYYLFFYVDVRSVYILDISKNIKLNSLLKLVICQYDENDRICKLTDFCATLMNKSTFLSDFTKSDLLLIKDKNQQEYMFDVTEKEYLYSGELIAKTKITKYDSYNKKHFQQYDFHYNADRYSSYLFYQKEYEILQNRKYYEFLKKPNFLDYYKP